MLDAVAVVTDNDIIESPESIEDWSFWIGWNDAGVTWDFGHMTRKAMREERPVAGGHARAV
jgi:hypothetical protein